MAELKGNKKEKKNYSQLGWQRSAYEKENEIRGGRINIDEKIEDKKKHTHCGIEKRSHQINVFYFMN